MAKHVRGKNMRVRYRLREQASPYPPIEETLASLGLQWEKLEAWTERSGNEIWQCAALAWSSGYVRSYLDQGLVNRAFTLGLASFERTLERSWSSAKQRGPSWCTPPFTAEDKSSAGAASQVPSESASHSTFPSPSPAFDAVTVGQLCGLVRTQQALLSHYEVRIAGLEDCLSACFRHYALTDPSVRQPLHRKPACLSGLAHSTFLAEAEDWAARGKTYREMYHKFNFSRAPYASHREEIRAVFARKKPA